jgi:hypothetical protein
LFLFLQYPVIGVDGWITVSNPVTGLPSGHLHVMLALGTEDQVQLLEVSRGLKEAVLTLPTTQNSSHSIQTASVRKFTSMEPFTHSTVHRHEPSLSGTSESQTRHINSYSSSVTSELLQNHHEQTHLPESLQECLYHNSDTVPTLDVQEHLESVSVDVNYLTESLPSSTSVSYRVRDERGPNSDTELWDNSFPNVVKHILFKKNQTTEDNIRELYSIQNQGQGPVVLFKDPAVRKEKCSQEPSFQFLADAVKAKHHYVDSSGTKEFSQFVVDQRVKKSDLQSQNDEFSQSGPKLQMYDLVNAKIDTDEPSYMQAKIGIGTKDQESQVDLLVLDVNISKTVTVQNTSKATESELHRSPPLEIISDICVNSDEVLHVQPEDWNDSQNSDSSQNEHKKGRLRGKELCPECSLMPLSHSPTKAKSDLKDSKSLCSESERTNLNSVSFLGMNNEASNARHLTSVLLESVESKSAEVDPERNFHVHLEIERAMHLQHFRQKAGSETAGAVIEPSTYVTFMVRQGCPNGNESEVKMFTPLMSHSTNPSWCWHCDTWLSSDLLMDVSVIIIFM